jgi:hypothetical protein
LGEDGIVIAQNIKEWSVIKEQIKKARSLRFLCVFPTIKSLLKKLAMLNYLFRYLCSFNERFKKDNARKELISLLRTL